MIESTQNPKIKELVKLRERRSRDKLGLFLIEGYRELLRAVDAGVAIETAYFCPSLFLGENELALLARIPQTTECAEDPFRKISYRDRPDGLLAVARQNHQGLDEIVLSPNPFFVVAEAIEKPGNLGTILRSSDATGVDGLIVCDRCTDIHNPNVVRASVGTLFTVPTYEATSQQTIDWLKANKISILAATPAADHLYTDVDLSGPVAIALGTEQLGLTDQWMDQADISVRLPMHGTADSLNVAMASTVLLYETLRQRR